MILWTIIPAEWVLAGIEETRQAGTELRIGSLHLEMEETTSRGYRITRLISSDPQDYLRPEYQPGEILQMVPQWKSP